MRRPANYRKIEAHHFSTYLINHSWCTECPPPGTYRRVANCKVLIIYNLSKRPATLWQSSQIISSCLQQHDNFLDQLNCNCKMSQIANFFLFSGLSDLILWNLNCNLQNEMWLVWREVSYHGLWFERFMPCSQFLSNKIWVYIRIDLYRRLPVSLVVWRQNLIF